MGLFSPFLPFFNLYLHSSLLGQFTFLYCSEKHVALSIQRIPSGKMLLSSYRSLKLQADITNHRPGEDRQQERSPRGSKSAAEEEKEA